MHRRGAAGALVLILLLVSVAAARPADPAAVLIQLSGKVEVQRAGKTTPAAVGASLEAGDRVVVPSGGKAVLMYRTGKMQTATATVTVEARQSEDVGNLYRQTVQTIAQVASTEAGRQPNRQGMIRPVAGEATPVAPRNDIRVLDVRPTFTWMNVPGATYIIQIRRTDRPGSAPLRFEAGRDTVWTYPATASPLVPGAVYQWSVGAGMNGRPAAPQTFRVIGSDEFTRLSQVLADISESGADPTADGQFVLALHYRNAGLYYEADRALRGIGNDGAGSGRLFHLLRGDVLDRIGDLEGASKAFQAADAGF